jgi:hypothetical protein
MTMTTDAPPPTDLDPRIDARRASLQAALAAVPRDEDLPASATQRDLAVNRHRRQTLERQLAALERAVSTWRELGSAEADEAWRAHLTEWRSVLCDELKQIKAYATRDPVVKGRAINLTLSVKTIDRGTDVLELSDYGLTTLRLGQLMIAAGYEVTDADPVLNYVGKLPWHGSLPEVEARLSKLAERRAAAEAALATALLSDEDRQQQEADAVALRRALDGMIVKVSADGTGLVAWRDRKAVLDDVQLSPSEMTPIERKAFERMAASFRFR